MKSIKLTHKGEDYIKVEVNGKEFEITHNAQMVEDQIDFLIKSIYKFHSNSNYGN